jgi:hypothetical protein
MPLKQLIRENNMIPFMLRKLARELGIPKWSQLSQKELEKLVKEKSEVLLVVAPEIERIVDILESKDTQITSIEQTPVEDFCKSQVSTEIVEEPQVPLSVENEKPSMYATVKAAVIAGKSKEEVFDMVRPLDNVRSDVELKKYINPIYYQNRKK